jgi:hypothetical protein
MQQNKLPFTIVALLSLIGMSMAISALDSKNSNDQILKVARLDENPVAL